MIHSSGSHGGYPQGYYGQGQAHGQFRHPGYPHMPSASNPSFQSMTSHWNISAPPAHPPPVPTYQPHTASSGSSNAPVGSSGSSGGGGGGGGGKNKHINNLSQFGLDIPQPKAPDKPLLPYMRFSRKMWEQLKAEGKRVCEVQSVGKLIGQKWRELSDEDKQPYFEEYEAEKAVYVEQVKRYKNSPAYKKWIEAKQQAEAAAREAALSSNALHSDYTPAPPTVIAPSRQSGAAEARMQMIQQQQEEEEDEYITMKQMAAVRFHRNHRLMLEIFNNASVPDTRTVVNKSRLQLLKKQVQSLTIHQKKLEDELSQLDARFEARKRKFVEDSEKFRRELKRIQDNPPTSWKKPQVCLSPKDVPQPIENPKYKKL